MDLEEKAVLYGKSRRAWAEALSVLPWDYFLTVTFRGKRRDAIYAHRQVGEFLSHYKRVFLAVEPFKYCGEIHLHGLLKTHRDFPTHDEGAVSAIWLWSKLFHEYGRSKVELVRSMNAVSRYCSKYVVKGASDYGIYGTDWNDATGIWNSESRDA